LMFRREQRRVLDRARVTQRQTARYPPRRGESGRNSFTLPAGSPSIACTNSSCGAPRRGNAQDISEVLVLICWELGSELVLSPWTPADVCTPEKSAVVGVDTHRALVVHHFLLDSPSTLLVRDEFSYRRQRRLHLCRGHPQPLEALNAKPKSRMRKGFTKRAIPQAVSGAASTCTVYTFGTSASSKTNASSLRINVRV
jgi:hypothetical protein